MQTSWRITKISCWLRSGNNLRPSCSSRNYTNSSMYIYKPQPVSRGWLCIKWIFAWRHWQPNTHVTSIKLVRKCRTSQFRLLSTKVQLWRKTGYRSVVQKALLSIRLVHSTVDSILYINLWYSSFIILTVVVDDLMFSSKIKRLMESFKTAIHWKFNVKLYGPWKAFIRWNIQRDGRGIEVSQNQYTDRMLARFGLIGYNPVLTKLGTNYDLRSALPNYNPLKSDQHHL